MVFRKTDYLQGGEILTRYHVRKKFQMDSGIKYQREIMIKESRRNVK